MKLGFGLAALTLAVAAPLGAHHSFGAEYDASAPLTLSGTVTMWSGLTRTPFFIWT